ncbi:MAG: caspase family protein [Desulfomonile sp.]|nr:caspase family protein [Desulfomonile sp.]
MSRTLIAVIVAVVLAAAAWQSASAANRALLVGVEEYSNPEYNLKGVKEDVRLLKEMLIRKNIFVDGEIRTLVNKEATRKAIISTFKDWLINSTKAGDLALFYFSGHGIQVWDENGDEVQDGKDEAILPWDAKVTGDREKRTFRGRTSVAFAQKTTENVILDDELGDLLKELKGRTVVFLSDSCHSGSVYKRINPHLVQYKTLEGPHSYKSVFETREATPTVAERPIEKTNIGGDLLVPGVNMAALTASEDSQPAEIAPFDRNPTGFHSVFTWYLLNGLEGKADLDGDGNITLNELVKFLEEEIKRGGYAQVPQHEFQPKGLETLVLASVGVPASQGSVEQPTRLLCSLKTDAGIAAHERTAIESKLRSAVPPLDWVPAERAACMIEVEKSGNSYGARLSDSTGSYWEARRGSTLDQVLQEVAKDARGYYVQANVIALRNPVNKIDLNLTYTVKSPAARKEGELVEGDYVDFRITPKSAGYLLIFSVDTVGTIYPLYPGRDGNLKSLAANQSVVAPENERLKVEAPFGRDLVFAVLTKAPPESVARFWKQDQIGDPDAVWLTGRTEFLEALWTEFTKSGRATNDWTSRLWLLKSFRSAK